MWFPSWLRTHNPSVAGKCDRASRRSVKPAAFRPRLEALDDRLVPSTLTVTNTDDDGPGFLVPGSLRYEVTHANTGDTIVFAKYVSSQTITLDSELVIDKSLTIKGQYQTITSRYDVGRFDLLPGSRIFEVVAGTTVAISDLAIDGGGGTRVGDSRVPGASYDGYGGAILNFGTLALSNCVLQGNSAQYGGAIANFGTMTVSNCGLVQNSAVEGGAIYNAGTATVSGCTLSGNTAHPVNIANTWIGGVGGGIYNAGTAAALTVSHSTFSGNTPDDIFGPYVGGHNTFG
jgi:hypothetical protein